jgi:2-oxo-3-hexenedioate decarboxylase
MDRLDPDAIATEALGALEGGGPIAPFSARAAGLDLARAYRAAAALRRLRQARGARPVGRKIGFTNRTIWAEYGVDAPIWGDLYDTTVVELAACDGRFALGRLAEPKIEPEIVVGLACAPTPDMDEAALLDCVAWVAHGYEVVQSPFPGWRFAAADTVAAGGMHGALLLGPRRALAPAERARWLAALAGFTIALARDGTVVDRGAAANVLGGPLSALRHLVGLLAHDPDNPPLAAGELVTTGTLTRALAVAPGETWTTALAGLDLDGIGVRLT